MRATKKPRHLLVGAKIAWREVDRKGRGKGLSGVEHSVTAMQQSITNLTQAIGLRNLIPLTAFKKAPNPKFAQNLSRRLSLGVPVRGSKICKKMSKFV